MKIVMLLALSLTACGGSPGAAGPTGPTGKTGTNGTNGTNGTSMTISSGITCSKSESGTGTFLNYTYESVVYSTGDRDVSCGVSSAAAGTHSSTDFYKAGTANAASGLCNTYLTLESPAAMSLWIFTSAAGTTKTQYSSAGSANDGYTYTFAAGDCTTF